MSRTEVVIGVDLGTTTSKALIQTRDGEQLALVEGRTRWATTPGGGTEAEADWFVALATDLIERSVQQAGEVDVVGIGVAGLAESGVLLDGDGRPQAPAIAWFDRRGTEQVARVGERNPAFGREFVRRTGLPWDSQASVAKLLWLADQGLALNGGHRWLSVPEYVVHRLGGARVHEPSLASRTGLLDQATGKVWLDGVTELGLPDTLLPEQLPAGVAAGRMNGAALTVAGHDHPVAAIGCGATGSDELFNSTGTADVFARALPGVLDDDQREALVGNGVSVGAHVLPDTTLLLGGVRGGLLMRRVLGLLGAAEGEARDQLDQAAVLVDELPPGLEITGAGPTGDEVLLRIRDDADPAAVWAATTRYTAAETRALLDVVHQVVPPHSRAVACGGWTRMASVRKAKQEVIDHLEFSPLREPGVVGAAVLAQQASIVPSPV